MHYSNTTIAKIVSVGQKLAENLCGQQFFCINLFKTYSQEGSSITWRKNIYGVLFFLVN